jgi:hypothetical protein
MAIFGCCPQGMLLVSHLAEPATDRLASPTRNKTRAPSVGDFECHADSKKTGLGCKSNLPRLCPKAFIFARCNKMGEYHSPRQLIEFTSFFLNGRMLPALELAVFCHGFAIDAAC